MNVLKFTRPKVNKQLLEVTKEVTKKNSSVEKIKLTLTSNDYENNFYADLGELECYLFTNGKLDLDTIKREELLTNFKSLRGDKSIIGSGDVLIITYVKIFKKYRSNGFGKFLLKYIEENFDCTIVLQAMPYEVSKSNKKEFRDELKKLIEFYSHNGFSRYPTPKNAENKKVIFMVNNVTGNLKVEETIRKGRLVKEDYRKLQLVA